jgi:Tfp pilus assembly protein PilN
MVRINLLPAEIIERRKYERYYPYVFVTGAVLLAVVVISWLGMQLLVSQRSDQLQQAEETVASLNQQAQALAIFEEQQESLAARQTLATQALADRVDMGSILEEVSLVLPDPLWLSEMTLNEDTGAIIKGYTPESSDAESDESYKAIAAGLVRLNSLDSLYDVWLTTAESENFEQFMGESEGDTRVVTFESTSKIAKPDATASASTVPAPPTTASN